MDTTNGATMSEAPVSWTVRYITPEGYDAMLTLRGTDTSKVMGTAKQAVAAMAKAGCKPQIGAHTTPAPIGNTEQAAPMCPTHKTPMKQSKHGGYYCAAKIADDDGSGKPIYCKAKA